MNAADLERHRAVTTDEVCELLRFDTTPNNDRRKVRKLVEAGVLHVVGGTVDPITGRKRRPVDWTFSRREVLAYIGEPQSAPETGGVSHLKVVGQ